MDTVEPAIDAGLLRLIRTRTGVSDAVAERAFRESSSFRSLCYDLRACNRALARWDSSDSETAGTRVAEYAQLLDELTEEIRLALSHDDHSPVERGRSGRPR